MFACQRIDVMMDLLVFQRSIEGDWNEIPSVRGKEMEICGEEVR